MGVGSPGTATSTPPGSGQQSQIAVVRLRMKLRFINACLTHVRFVPAIHGLQDSRERYPPFPAQAEFKHQATVKINSDQA